MRARRSRSHSWNGLARAGFTLVEVIVVIVLLAIMAAMVIPQMSGASATKAQSAARLLMSDLEYAQNLAVTSQSDITVTFDTGGNSYTVSNESGTLIHPITKQAYTVDLDEVRGLGGVSLSNADFGGSLAVTFNALGAPSADGSVALSAGAHGYQVAVAPITGRVTVTAAE